MWEFAIRIFAAGGLVAAAGWTGRPRFEVACLIAVVTAAYALLGYLVESRSKTNPGFAGLVAGLDALAIAGSLAYAGLLDSLGLIVLAPIVYAVAKRGSNPIATGCIGAGALVGAGELVSAGVPHWPSYGQAAAVLAISLLSNQKRIVVRPKTISEMIAELAAESAQDVESSTQALIELREKYRRLSKAYRDLEKRSRVSRIGVDLLLCRDKPGHDLSGMTERLKSILELDGIVLSTVNTEGDSMIVTASAGRVPEEVSAFTFRVRTSDAAAKIRDSGDAALKGLIGEKGIPYCNALLKRKGMVVGMLTAMVENADRLSEIQGQIEELSEILGSIMVEERFRRIQARRMREAETLYEIAAWMDGSASETDLARRTARAIAEMIDCDHVGIWSFQGNRLKPLARAGRNVEVLGCLNVEPADFEGWIRMGAPTLAAHIASEHPMVNRIEAVRRRIASLIIAPIEGAKKVEGFISVASAKAGALGKDELRIVTNVCAELAHRFSTQTSTSSRGLLTAEQFQQEILALGEGDACLAFVEPSRFGEAEETAGVAAVHAAARKLSLLCKRHSPATAKMCRRSDGSLVVLLPGHGVEDAEAWARNLTTVAAMHAADSPAPGMSIPLAVRVRVADLNARIGQASLE